MEDLQFRRRKDRPQDGMHFQWVIGTVLVIFCVGAYLFVLNFEQHRPPTPDDAEWVALRYATPFVIGAALAWGNAFAMLGGRRVPTLVRTLPVFALVGSIITFVVCLRLFLV